MSKSSWVSIKRNLVVIEACVKPKNYAILILMHITYYYAIHKFFFTKYLLYIGPGPELKLPAQIKR